MVVKRKILDKPWPVLLIQQGMLFVSGWVLLNLIRLFFGRTIHGAKEPMHWIDLLLVTTVSVLTAAVSLRLYAKTTAKPPEKLGIRCSARRLGEFIAGFAVFSLLSAGPSLIGLANGSLRLETTILASQGLVTTVNYLAIATVGLLVNSFYEEITSRAFPLQILEGTSLILAILWSSVLFALIHFVDEPVKVGRFLGLFYAGVLFALCYLLTENIWLASGVHTALNWAGIWNEGIWHAGSIIKTTGEIKAPLAIYDIAELLPLAILGALVYLKRARWQPRPK